MRAMYLLPVVFISATALAGVHERQYPSVKEFFTRARAPKYPFEARHINQQGEGLFRLYIDRSGHVTAVKMLQSTGHPLLDDAAVKAILSWRAPSGLRRETEIPVTFTMDPHYHPPPKRPVVVREFTD